MAVRISKGVAWAGVRLALAGAAALLSLTAVAPPANPAAQSPTAAADAPNGDYGGYYTWPEVMEKIAGWRARYPALVHVGSLGKTVEGRDIPLLRLCDNADPESDAAEPEVLLMAGIHPREQQPQVCLYRLVDELLAGYGKDERLTRILRERQVWVIPMLNVDGKVYDMKRGNGKDKGADWRKNRRAHPAGKAVGVDLNRNFPVRWGGFRDPDPLWRTTTVNPSGSIYEGRAPLSEPETAALAKFIESRPNLRAFLDIHSPLRCILFPAHLIGPEHARFSRLAGGMRDRQKDKPYRITKSEPDSEPRPGTRTSNTGLTYTWAFYTRGVYSLNFEVGLDARYPPVKEIEAEYAKNVREPLLHFLEVGGEMPAARPGMASLLGGSVEGGAKLRPGSTVSYAPRIAGECAYAVLVSESPDVVVTSEYRNVPVKAGFTLRAPEAAKPGAKAPMALYLWDRNRGLSVARFTLTVEE